MTRKPGSKPGPTLRRGAVIVLVTLMLTALFVMVAFVSDIGNIIVNRTTLGAAADSAALAAAGALAQHQSMDDAKAVAVDYAQKNVPDNYGTVADTASVTFGNWNPDTLTFTASNTEPDAVRVVVHRNQAGGNPVPYFFGRILGLTSTDLSAEAIAVGAVNTPVASVDNAVYVTSSKDLSNVVLEFADGQRQKFEGLSGYTGTFQGTGDNAGKEVVCVWIKSGCNSSSEGPGYGERIDNSGSDATIHGANAAKGCTPHVTATFQATGVTFLTSGSTSPVRLVK